MRMNQRRGNAWNKKDWTEKTTQKWLNSKYNYEYSRKNNEPKPLETETKKFSALCRRWKIQFQETAKNNYNNKLKFNTSKNVQHVTSKLDYLILLNAESYDKEIFKLRRYLTHKFNKNSNVTQKSFSKVKRSLITCLSLNSRQRSSKEKKIANYWQKSNNWRII